MTRFRRQDLFVILAGLLMSLAAHLLFIDWDKVIPCLQTQGNCWPPSGVDRLSKLYDKNLRSDFFSGFLAVGAFLLSLKTFIVMTMKTNVYDTAEYEKRWNNNRSLDEKGTGPRYKGLKELNDCMFNSIFFTLSAAISQVTIGIAGGITMTFVALTLCTISIAYLIYSLILVKTNLNEIIPET